MSHIKISSPIHNSPKKPRVAPSTTKKPPATPSKSTPVKAKAALPTKFKSTPAVNNKSISPSKAASAKKSKAYVNLCPCNLPHKIVDRIFILALY